MSAIQMNLGYEYPAVELPCAFIDGYMLKCPPVYALIYIYGFRRCIGGAAPVSSQEIAESFQILETDVVNAWRFWENEGLIRLDTQSEGMSITFLPVPSAQAAEPKTDEPSVGLAVLKPLVPAGRPQYTVEELTIYRRQSRDIERLFAHAEQTLGKLLTYHDMNVLFGFYDWLRLPVDVISFLLTYSADHDHRDLRYIEKAAMDWAENQIDDVEKALAHVQTFDHDYHEILRAMGQTSAYPSPTQRKYIQKWLKEYGIPAELVLEACDRAAVNTGKTNVRYVDKIIEDWHTKGIRTLDGAREADGEYARQKAQSAKTEAKPKAARGNRFVNFKQRERDYAQLEKMEREYLLQSLKG